MDSIARCGIYVSHFDLFSFPRRPSSSPRPCEGSGLASPEAAWPVTRSPLEETEILREFLQMKGMARHVRTCAGLVIAFGSR